MAGRALTHELALDHHHPKHATPCQVKDDVILSVCGNEIN